MIDYSRLRSVTARQLSTALNADGFAILTFHHSSDTFPLGTLRSMIEKQARWSEEDLRRLDLLS